MFWEGGAEVCVASRIGIVDAKRTSQTREYIGERVLRKAPLPETQLYKDRSCLRKGTLTAVKSFTNV